MLTKGNVNVYVKPALHVLVCVIYTMIGEKKNTRRMGNILAYFVLFTFT